MLSLLLALAGALLTAWAVFAFSNPTVIVRWSTATEFETAGYAVYRGESPDGPFEKVSDALIPAAGDPISGGDYEFIDRDVEPGKTYYYMLEEVELSGGANREGPVVSTADRRGLIEGAVGIILFITGAAFVRFSPRRARPVSP
jgi:hypothetical protein